MFDLILKAIGNGVVADSIEFPKVEVPASPADLVVSAAYLSPRGMLVACDAPARVGDKAIVSFLAPGRDTLWLDAEADISRVIHGMRDGDPGFCLALDFTYFEKSARNELLCRLAGTPPPIPQRRGRELSRKSDLMEMSVVVRPIIPIMPRGFHLGIPGGVFGA